jgi:transposase
MRDFPRPASTASPGSANPVLHRFDHSTIFVCQMAHSLGARKHLLKTRGNLLSILVTNHGSPLGPTTRHVTRTKIKALWEQGATQRGIAKTVGCGLATVARWVHKFKEAEGAGLPDNTAVLDKPRSGARPKLTKAIGKAIVKFTEGKRNRHLSAIRVHVQRRFGVTLTSKRIGQHLWEEGLKPFRPQKQPLLLPQQKKKRVKFAKKHLRHDWHMTLFTDESEFLLHPKTTNKKNDVVWARRREDVPPLEVKQYSAKVRVWGGVSAQGNTRLLLYSGDLTGAKYRALLKRAKPDFNKIFGSTNRNWTFVHDGASPHKAQATNEWLAENVPNHVESGPHGEWPANSPDLNPIEQVWGYMKNELERNKPRSIHTLKRRIQQIWANIDEDFVQKQADGMKKRLKSVIESGGEYTAN